jgi:hypothetical protein
MDKIGSQHKSETFFIHVAMATQSTDDQMFNLFCNCKIQTVYKLKLILLNACFIDVIKPPKCKCQWITAEGTLNKSGYLVQPTFIYT